jgi:acetylcholinesterase
LKVYDGSILSGTQNVIVVSIEYRVESLGFLYLGTPDAPGNQGLHDQQLALQWIEKNMKYFGGDSQRVTLFGESAGAVSVGLHLLSPKSRSLFRNAILESSGPTGKWAVLTPQIAKYRAEKFLTAFTRYISERSQLSSNDSENVSIPIQCQQRLVTTEEKFSCVKAYPIVSVQHFRVSWSLESYNGDPVGYTFVATVDGDFLPYDPEQMLLNGDFKRCSLLLGVNKDEGSYFNVYVPHGNMTFHSMAEVDAPTFQRAMKEYFRHLPTYPIERSPMILESILQTYTLWNDLNNPLANAIQLSLAVGENISPSFSSRCVLSPDTLSLSLCSGDYHFTCPTVYLADIYAQENLPVYFYYFTLRSSTSPWHPWMGVVHCETSTWEERRPCLSLA